MAYVFENFVRNFFRLEQKAFRVASIHIQWDTTPDEEQLQILPRMRPDIHLEKGDQRILIDTKYYAHTLQTHYGKNTIHSENLYQLFSYLKNAEARGSAYKDAEGILLYPAVGEKIAFGTVIQGHRVRVCTVNLDRPWQKIRPELLAVIGVVESTKESPRSSVTRRFVYSVQ